MSEQKLTAEDALREIASYLSVGGFNSETVDPEKYLEKIKWGIDEHIKNALDVQFRMTHGEI